MVARGTPDSARAGRSAVLALAIGAQLVSGCRDAPQRIASTRASTAGPGDSASTMAPSRDSGPLTGDTMHLERPAVPQRFAVVEHTAEGARVVLVDLGTGRKHPLPETDGEPHQPTWSPDGRDLLYRVADTLFWYRETVDSFLPALTRLNPQPATPYAFSPDGGMIAASLLEGVALIRTTDLSAGRTGGLRVPMPAGCRVADLAWSPIGDPVVSLCYPSPGTEATEVLEIPIGSPAGADAHPGATRRYLGDGLTRLLGWQRETGSLLLVRSGEVEEIVALLSGTGHPRSVAKLPAGAFVLAYLPSSNQVIVAHAVEDEADPATLDMMPLGDGSPRRWLTNFPRLSDLSVTAQGTWAMFVDRMRPELGGTGGDVYLVPVGEATAQLVLRAKPGTVSYSAPVAAP